MDHVDWGIISSYGGLLSLASISVLAGAFGSLPSTGQPTSKPRNLLEPEDEEEENISEVLSSADAWIFPIVGSVALFGTYLLVQYFGKEWLNRLLGWYLSFVGAGCVWRCLVCLARLVTGRDRWRRFDRTRVFVLKGPLELFSMSLRTPTLVLLPVSLIPSLLYVSSETNRKSIILTNILALALAHNALSILRLDSFQTGCVLLSGLFLYDVYWVFGTKVMVEVATSLDVPIKILWPKSLSFTTDKGSTMLGLGDIVIPGMFVALALRYDYSRSKKTESFTKPYFFVTLTSYTLGLVTTMTVMHTFGRAQPALLYLSPACILAFLVTAFFRGEFRDAWAWSDNPEQRQGDRPLAVNTDGPEDVAPSVMQTKILDGSIQIEKADTSQQVKRGQDEKDSLKTAHESGRSKSKKSSRGRKDA
ncbi:signal peptide peptidase-domain-containing protein [Pisolithus thermaeus]|nr:signal peptide peptidase-domain-containing protein [Pisolithus thermaeus]